MLGPSCLRLGRVSRCWGQVVSDWAECLDAGAKLSQIGPSVSMLGPSCLRPNCLEFIDNVLTALLNQKQK